MLSLLIVFALFVLSIGLVVRFGLSGLATAVGLVGSDTDSAGPLYWIINYFSSYKVPIRGLIIFATLIAIYRMVKRGLFLRVNRSFFLFYALPLGLVSVIVVALALVRGQGVVVGFSELIWLGIPFFYIWVAGSHRFRSANLFIFFVLVQGLVAMLVILAGSLTADLNGASYAGIIGGERWVVDPKDMINAPVAFFNFNKYDLSVMKFGQFHNPNALGVYSVVLIVISIHGILKAISEGKRKGRVVLWTIPMIGGVILWMNSLTRGPMLILLGWGLTHLVLRIRSRRMIIIMSVLGLLALVGLIINLDQITILRYLIVQSDDVSVVSRLSGYEFAFNSIINSPLVGRMASPSDAVPHILTLKVAAYYGLPAAILITVPFIHAGGHMVKMLIKDHKLMNSLDFNYSAAILGVMLSAFLTNGVVTYVLFWIAFAEVLNKIDIYRPKNDMAIYS